MLELLLGRGDLALVISGVEYFLIATVSSTEHWDARASIVNPCERRSFLLSTLMPWFFFTVLISSICFWRECFFSSNSAFLWVFLLSKVFSLSWRRNHCVWFIRRVLIKLSHFSEIPCCFGTAMPLLKTSSKVLGRDETISQICSNGLIKCRRDVGDKVQTNTGLYNQYNNYGKQTLCLRVTEPVKFNTRVVDHDTRNLI